MRKQSCARRQTFIIRNAQVGVLNFKHESKMSCSLAKSYNKKDINGGQLSKNAGRDAYRQEVRYADRQEGQDR